jgi:hypothetical protein
MFEVEDLPLYYINGPKISDVLVYIISLEEHVWGVKVLPYTGCMKGLIFAKWTLCLKYVLGIINLGTYIHIGGWWILCVNETYTKGHAYLLLFFPHLFCVSFYLQVEGLGIHTCNSCSDLCRRGGLVNFQIT